MKKNKFLKTLLFNGFWMMRVSNSTKILDESTRKSLPVFSNRLKRTKRNSLKSLQFALLVTYSSLLSKQLSTSLHLNNVKRSQNSS